MSKRPHVLVNHRKWQVSIPIVNSPVLVFLISCSRLTLAPWKTPLRLPIYARKPHRAFSPISRTCSTQRGSNSPSELHRWEKRSAMKSILVITRFGAVNLNKWKSSFFVLQTARNNGMDIGENDVFNGIAPSDLKVIDFNSGITIVMN